MNGQILLKSMWVYLQKDQLKLWNTMIEIMNRLSIQLDRAEEGISKLDDKSDNMEWQ